MRSRIAVVAILALGVLMSGAGATLAVDGLTSDGSAGRAQYPPTFPPNNPNPGGPTVVAGQEEDSGTIDDEVAGEEEQGGGGSQGADQEGAGDDKLAFTGFAAIPVLLGGLGLLATGLALRRRVE